MRKALTAAALLLALSCPALAGEMATPGVAAPPASANVGGKIPNDARAAGIMPNEAPDSLTRIALNLLAVLPSLF